MNRRTCPHCGGRSYSSYSGPDWDCPYCGKDLGDVPDELIDNTVNSQGVKAEKGKLYSINDGKSEN